MTLLISKEKYDIDFVKYIIKFLRHYILGILDYYKLKKIENYINLMYDFSKSYIKKIDILDIIKISLQNLRIFESKKYYEIRIDNNVTYYYTNIKIVDLCKLINYGALDLREYPIYTNAFEYIKNNIEALYHSYEEGVVI